MIAKFTDDYTLLCCGVVSHMHGFLALLTCGVNAID